MWLVYRYRHVEPPHTVYLRAIDLDQHPAPEIAAGGIAAVNRSQYWLADEPPARARVTAPPGAGRAQKPPYRIPTLEEIRQIPWNGLNVVSAFAGAGGSSTGYRMSGYRVLAAVEFVPEAADSYEANCAEYTKVLRRDVRELDAAELLEIVGLAAGELDVLDGSPPCEPFSTAGRRERTWNSVREYSGQRQRTDDLFFEYARLVEGVRPRVFVAENVTGLARGRARGYFKRIMAALRECGYRVAARTLDASWLGVPQSRKRIIIIGVRDDLAVDPAFPAPLPYQFTVRDAIGDLLAGDRARMGSFSRKRHPADITDAPAPTVVSGDSPYWHVDGKLDLVKGGYHAGQRVDLNQRPAPTVTTSAGQFGAEPCELVEDVEHVYDGHGFDEAHRSLDAPAATVRAAHGGGGAGADLVGVYRDTGGRHQAPGGRNRVDEPSPTISNGGHPGANAGHYEVEIGYYVDTGGEFGVDPRVDRIDRPSPTILVGEGSRDAGHYQVEEVFDQQTVGNEAYKPQFGPLENPHPTITATYGYSDDHRTSGELRSSVTRVRRRFTIPELRRICGFPDDYVLTGSFSQQWERLGDAVPPPMAAAWARELAAGPLAASR